MFEFFFKYPRQVFSQGSFVFLNGWPVWMLWVGVLLAAAALGYLVWRRAGGSAHINPIRSAAIWLLQTGLAALLLFMLWHPALSVATLKPQQNIVAVVVDGSSSMAAKDEDSKAREERAIEVLNAGLLNKLRDKFQVRV